MKKYLSGLLIVLCLGKSSMAQQQLIDSITKELQQPMADTNRAISLMRLAIDYEVLDTAKAYKAYNNAIAFAKEKKLYYQLGRIYHNQSYLYSVAARYADTKASLEKAIDYYQKSNHSKAPKWIASAWGDIANALKILNDIEQAIQYNLKSISLFEQLNLNDDAVTRYCNVSTLFGDIREFDKQKEYAHKALVAAKKTGTKLSLNMAYFIISLSYSMQEKNKIAKIYLDSSRLYFNKNSNVDYLLTYYLITAQVYRKLNQFDSAFYYFGKSYDISREYNYSFGQAESQIQMGAISILQKKYAAAEIYLKKGIGEAEAINYFTILDEGYKYLSDIYAIKGNYRTAYAYYQKYKEVSDSAANMDSRKFATELEKKYETEKKEILIHHLEVEKKIQDLSLLKKSTFNYILICGIAALLVIAFLFYRVLRNKHKLQKQRIIELETEKQLEATEAVLKGEEQERTRMAKDLHDGLGGMLSGIKYSFTSMKNNLIMTPDNQLTFERSLDMLDSSIKEMRRVAHNMMPEALVRFGLDTALKDFCNDINQSGALKINYQSIGMEGTSLDQTIGITLYRIVQELLNNIMKHAKAKSAIVQINKLNNLLSVTVEDDGQGFDTGILKLNKGIGWVNIKNRVEFLKGKLDISSKEGEGTSVQIELNI